MGSSALISGISDPSVPSPFILAISAMTKSMPGMVAMIGGRMLSESVAGGVMATAFCRILGSSCTTVEPAIRPLPKPVESMLGDSAMTSAGSAAVSKPYVCPATWAMFTASCWSLIPVFANAKAISFLLALPRSRGEAPYSPWSGQPRSAIDPPTMTVV